MIVGSSIDGKKHDFFSLIDNVRVGLIETKGLIVSECLLSACVDFFFISDNVRVAAAEHKNTCLL